MATVGLSSYMYPEMYSADWSTWFVCSMFTPICFLIGYCISLTMRMPANIRRTMAITTGTKSLALCLTIIAVSFPESEYLKYLAFPELHSVMMMAEFTAYCAGYKVYVWLGKGFNAQAHTKKCFAGSFDTERQRKR